jgi:hypothetical protein
MIGMALERPVSAQSSRRRLILAVFLVPILLIAVLWLPSWWENREFQQVQAIAGVGSRIVAGNLTDARRKIDPGASAQKIEAAIGKASFAVGTDGKDSRREIWTYYFADGTMIVNLTDGTAVRVSTYYGPPKIPKTTRQD